MGGEALEVILLDGNETLLATYRNRCNLTLHRPGQLVVEPRGTTVEYYGVSVTPGHGWTYSWSSGFLGLSHLKKRMPSAEIHVLGMNWRNGRPGAHPFAFE